jgi:hypothetical protein
MKNRGISCNNIPCDLIIEDVPHFIYNLKSGSSLCKPVIPAKAGIQFFCKRGWMPAPISTGAGSGAGMTVKLPDPSFKIEYPQGHLFSL